MAFSSSDLQTVGGSRLSSGGTLIKLLYLSFQFDLSRRISRRINCADFQEFTLWPGGSHDGDLQLRIALPLCEKDRRSMRFCTFANAEGTSKQPVVIFRSFEDRFVTKR